MIFEEAMKAMREGKTVARGKWTEKSFADHHYRLGSLFGFKCIVNDLGFRAYIQQHELLVEDWVVLNEIQGGQKQ